MPSLLPQHACGVSRALPVSKPVPMVSVTDWGSTVPLRAAAATHGVAY